MKSIKTPYNIDIMPLKDYLLDILDSLKDNDWKVDKIITCINDSIHFAKEEQKEIDENL